MIIQWLTDYLSYSAAIKIPFIVASMYIFVICMGSIMVNINDWFISIWVYSQKGWFQLTYPNFSDKVVCIKYSHYIVNRGTGEILYINKKIFKKLKKRNLIVWDHEIKNYCFHNESLSEVKDLSQPHIIIWDKLISE